MGILDWSIALVQNQGECRIVWYHFFKASNVIIEGLHKKGSLTRRRVTQGLQAQSLGAILLCIR